MAQKATQFVFFSYLGQRHILEEEEKHFKESATEIAFKNEFAR